MTERKVRRKKKASLFTGEPVRFRTSGSPLHVLKNLLKARWSLPSGVSTLLLMIYVFVYSSEFLILLNPLDALESLTFSEMGAGVDDTRSDDIEQFKADIGILIYASVLIYSLFYIKTIISVIIDNPHLILIMALLLFGMSYSVNPQEVLFSVIQIGVGILIALLYAIQLRHRERWDKSFCLAVLFPLVLVHVYSLILFFANGLDILDFVGGSSRFGGLPGNPNVAGASAVIGVWCSLYLLLSRSNSAFVKLYCMAALSLFVFTIALSGSGTSITVSIAVAALLIWLKFLSLFQSVVKRTLYIASGVLAMTLLIGVIAINNSTEELTESFTSSLGKRTDFTGRTDLWEIGVAAIKEKPVVGWSFDQHETVQEDRRFELPFELAHFHNGFVDTAVAGGLVLLGLALWNIASYVKKCFRVWANTDYLYGFVGPAVILILMNLSEYSLLRPLNVVFQFYLTAYFLLIFAVRTLDGVNDAGVPEADSNKAAKTQSDRRRRSGSGVRYRF